MTMARRLCSVALAIGLMAGAAPAQEQVTLTADQMRGFATQLLQAGDAPRVLAVSDALLARNPNDVGALILRARAALMLGEQGIALEAARTAYGASDVGNAKFVAARLAALAHAELQQDTRAQIWLRRARQYAPNDAEATEVAQDYGFLRRRNPWTTQLRFGISPTNNVNNGSSAESFFLFTPLGGGDAILNNEARALSGLAINGGISTRYRLTESSNSITFLEGSANGVTYVLSQDAKDGLAEDRDSANAQRVERCIQTAENNIRIGNILIAEGEALVAEGNAATPRDDAKIAEGERKIAEGNALVTAGENPGPCVIDGSPLPTGADYAFAGVSVGLSHRRILSEGALPTSLGLRYSQSWYGGDPYAQTLNLNAGQSWRWGDDREITAYAFAERRFYDADRPTTTSLGLNARLDVDRDNGDRLTWRTGARRQISETTSLQYRSLSLGFTYDRAAPVAGISYDLSVEASRDYDYPFASLYLTSRVDNALTLRVDAEVSEIEYFGFSPVVSLEARAVDSNVDRFDQRNLSLGFDLRSSF